MATNILQRSDLELGSLVPGAELLGYPAGAAASAPPVRFTFDQMRPRIANGATNYYPPYGCSPNSGSGAISANLIYAFIVLDDTAISALATEVATLLAGAGVAGIYSPDSDPLSANFRMPKTLRSTGGVIDTSTTGIKSFALADKVKAGEWIAMNLSAAVTLRQMSASAAILSPIFGVTTLNAASPRSYVTAPYVYDGTLPAAFPTLTLASSGSPPALFLKG
jgi:hypothetical protein